MTGRALLLVAALALAGCSTTRTLMPTPNLYATGLREPFGELDPSLESDRADLLYVTDRLLEKGEDGHVEYGFGRDRALTVGSAVIRFGEGLGWDGLARLSREADRPEAVVMSVERLTERIRFPETPFKFRIEAEEPRLVEDAASVEALARATAALRAEIGRRLERTPKKEVFLYVHGFNNTFEETAFVCAELWHFLGREGVPILYAWPAGAGGPAGYGYDRESGEFTVFHLKQLLRALGSFPEIERIQILAHSRGTDVTTSALRELFLETWAAGGSARERFRIANLVLAAPDLDAEVAGQRIFGEKIGLGVGRLTIHASQGDMAIGFAEALFGSLFRLGRASGETLPPEVAEYLGRHDNVDVVDNRVEGNIVGHDYFHSHPASSSDLILVLRYDLPAGGAARPLTPVAEGIWTLSNGYPAPRREDR